MSEFGARVCRLVRQIEYRGMELDGVCENGRWFLRWGAKEGTCNVTGQPMSWWGRKWRLSPHMTDGEVVATAFKALLTALEHEARELFTFQGAAVYDSHVDIYKLVELRQKPDALSERDHTSSSRADPIARTVLHGWGFWDETWSHFHGSFPSEDAAREGLRVYSAWLDRGGPLPEGTGTVFAAA